jgi:hypothetical protein
MPNPTFTQPKFDAPIADENGRCTRSWFLAFQSLWNASPEFAVTPTGSPFTFHVPQPGNLLVVGGTVSAISLTRSSLEATGLTAGFIPCSTEDDVTITYTVPPTLVFFPR